MADQPPRLPADAGAAAATDAPPRRSLLSPWVVFPLLGAVLMLTVLLTPQPARERDPRLTTHEAGPMNARALYETLARLGWRVRRDSQPLPRRPLDSTATYAVLAPVIPLVARDVHQLLDAVRRGAGLVVVASGDGPLADSLGIVPSRGGAPQRRDSATIRSCPAEERYFGLDWPDHEVYSYWLVARRPVPADTVTFREVRRDSVVAGSRRRGVKPDTVHRLMPAAIGVPLGRGRVVIVADPDWLRNDVLRVCRWGAARAAVRMFEWVAPRDGPRTVVFDEFHQDYGTHPSPTRALARATLSPTGRTILQLLVAALVLLAALGPRPLAPVSHDRHERRSPLEHVGALARAYEQIGATRLATRRLVRGLRRRTAAGSLRAAPDDEYLTALADRFPKLAPEIGVVRDALTHPRTAAEFLEVGAAVETIERTILP